MVSAVAIDALRPVARQQGIQIPNLLPVARWIDGRALAAGVAEDYPLPTDASQTPNVKGTILGITATNGPLWFNFGGVASAVGSDISNGTASGMLRTDAGASYLIAVPPGATVMSLFCAATCQVAIEVWA